MLTVTNHLLIFHVPQHSLQEDLLHDLSRPQGETNCPVAPFLKIRIVSLFLVSENFTKLL